MYVTTPTWIDLLLILHFKKPQTSLASNLKEESVSVSVSLSPEFDRPNTQFLRSHLGGYFPKIPSDGATIGGITSDVWYTPWKLINIGLVCLQLHPLEKASTDHPKPHQLNVVVAMKGNRNDQESVFTAEGKWVTHL